MLAGQEITKREARWIACDTPLHSVTSAVLQGEPGASALSALSGCRRLRRLCLLGTRLGDAGAQELTLRLQDGGFEGLQELSVSACGMGLGGGLGALLQALRQPGNALALKVSERGRVKGRGADVRRGLPPCCARLGGGRPTGPRLCRP